MKPQANMFDHWYYLIPSLSFCRPEETFTVADQGYQCSYLAPDEARSRKAPLMHQLYQLRDFVFMISNSLEAPLCINSNIMCI